MENITKTFGPVKALTDVNLSVDRGEIHAICGENGAGKSTLMNVLSGVYPYGSYSGKITFDGKECKYHTINDSEADGIVIIHQELALSPFLSIAENIFIGNEQAKGGVIDWDKTRAEAKKLLDRVGLPEDPDTKVMDIGVGKQQLVEIAKALSKDVKLLILDEPTAGLDPRERVRFRNLISALADRRIILLSTHIVSDVEYIADEILMMREGKLIHTGNPEKIICPMQGKVWECHSDAAGAKALSRQHTIANLRREKDAVVLRVIAEHPPMPQARMLTPTLEDLYLYCFGEEQDDAHADRI